MIESNPVAAGEYAFAKRLETDLNCTQTLDKSDADMGPGSVDIDTLRTGTDGRVSGKFNTYVSVADSHFPQFKGDFIAEYCATGTEKFSCR